MHHSNPSEIGPSSRVQVSHLVPEVGPALYDALAVGPALGGAQKASAPS